jgi:hypothetical protein
MKIRRFNENTEGDFISIEEVKEIFAHLYDFQDLNIEIAKKWASGSSEYHLSSDEYDNDDNDIEVMTITADLDLKDSISLYVDYGVDSYGASTGDLQTTNQILTEIIDASKHLESQGYETHTELHNYVFLITISRKGTLIL